MSANDPLEPPSRLIQVAAEIAKKVENAIAEAYNLGVQAVEIYNLTQRGIQLYNRMEQLQAENETLKAELYSESSGAEEDRVELAEFLQDGKLYRFIFEGTWNSAHDALKVDNEFDFEDYVDDWHAKIATRIEEIGGEYFFEDGELICPTCNKEITELAHVKSADLGWAGKPCGCYISAKTWEFTNGFRRTKDGWPLSSFEPIGGEQR